MLLEKNWQKAIFFFAVAINLAVALADLMNAIQLVSATAGFLIFYKIETQKRDRWGTFEVFAARSACILCGFGASGFNICRRAGHSRVHRHRNAEGLPTPEARVSVLDTPNQT